MIELFVAGLAIALSIVSMILTVLTWRRIRDTDEAQ